jgi:hypothetical protein
VQHSTLSIELPSMLATPASLPTQGLHRPSTVRALRPAVPCAARFTPRASHALCRPVLHTTLRLGTRRRPSGRWTVHAAGGEESGDASTEPTRWFFGYGATIHAAVITKRKLSPLAESRGVLKVLSLPPPLAV